MNFRRRSTDQAQASTESRPDGLSLVAFLVAGQNYAIDILTVREIRAWSGATLLPGAPSAVRGVINLRGAIIPVIDLSQLFGSGTTEATSNHIVIVVDSPVGLVGLLAHSVNDILSVPPSALSAIPAQGEGLQFFSGLASHEDQMLAVLSIENIAVSLTTRTPSIQHEIQHVA